MIKSRLNKKLHVLAYHQILDDKNFEKQIILIKRKFSLISIEQLEGFLFENKMLPKNPLLITFDDGHYSLYDKALPILKSHQAPAVIFVVTDLIDKNKAFWWDEILYHFDGQKGQKKVWEVKEISNKERENFIRLLKLRSKKEELKYPQLKSSQLREMHDRGITIANHSHTHPMFDQCTDAELILELEKSADFLDKLNLKSDIFAYPNGNFSKKSENILKRKHIKMAFLFDHKINKDSIDPLRISRLVVDDKTPIWKFRLILSGWHTLILPFTKRLGKFMKN